MEESSGSASVGGAQATVDIGSFSDDSGSCSSATAAGSGQRKRAAASQLEGSCSKQRGVGTCGSSAEHERLPAYQALTVTQRAILRRLTSIMDPEQDSVVITNPLQPQGPIVYVTNAWQDMCGYTTSQAVGQNPRLTQGEGTDPETVKSMRKALTAQQPCRVRIINYRGYNHEPFWNCLSVHPIFFNREVVLFAARLQDYSHRLQRLVSLTPAQFCKSGDLFQMKVRLPQVTSAKSFNHPRIVEVTPGDIGLEDDAGNSSSGAGGTTDGETTTVEEGSSASEAGDDGSYTRGSAGAPPHLPVKHVKRLGFGGLALEPEYLLDRLRHECAELQLPCQAHEVQVHGAEVMRMEVCSAGPLAAAPPPLGMVAAGGSSLAPGSSSSGAGSSGAGSLAPIPPGGVPIGGGAGGNMRGSEGLRALVHVMPEDGDGTYSISLMRLVGDTFEFHALYRSLRERLQDITVPPKPPGIILAAGSRS